MARKGIDDQEEQENSGPAAPRDPVAKRSGFFIMFESVIEASPRNGGKPSQDIYLEGRLYEVARFTGGVTDEGILELLKNCSGFRKLVHSIGVSVKARSEKTATVDFVLQHWGKTRKYESGTTLRSSMPLYSHAILQQSSIQTIAFKC